LVMATQNPIEQEGTYPLPEAQLDRFLMQVNIYYPAAESEQKILQLARQKAHTNATQPAITPLPQEILFQAREEVLSIHLAEPLEEYIVQLIIATRQPERYDPALSQQVRFGASPRGTIALDRCARAHAWIAGRDYVSPEDIHAVLHDVLRHRILLTFEAEAEGVTTDQFISTLLTLVPVP